MSAKVLGPLGVDRARPEATRLEQLRPGHGSGARGDPSDGADAG